MKLNLGENIRKYRTRLGWTQGQLAERIGTSVQSVSRWESGGGYPDMELLPVLAKTFGVTADELLGCGEPEKKLTRKERTNWVCGTIRSMNTDPAEAAAVLRTVRTEYLQEMPYICSSLALPLHRRYRDDDDFMAELRLLTEAYMEQGTGGSYKAFLLQIMAQIEDDAHFTAMLEKYPVSAGRGLSHLSLQMKRAWANREWDRCRILRQKKQMEELHVFLNPRPILQTECGAEADMPARNPAMCRENSEHRLNVIAAVSGIPLCSRYPVSGDGILDCWAASRVTVGMEYAAQLSVLGEESRALTVLEDCAELMAQALDFPNATDTFLNGCSCREERISVLCRGAEFADMDVRRSPCCFGDKRIAFVAFQVENEPWETGCITLGHMDTSVVPLTDRVIRSSDFFHPIWFDPIRDHPRYTAVVERIRTCADKRKQQ